jgi:drug/metabolite transporter (DMT)-like permease
VSRNRYPFCSKLSTRLRADLFLLSAAVIWGTGFVAQRVAAADIGAFSFNGLRFLLAAAVLLPFARRDWKRLDKKGWSGVGLLGVLLVGAAAFQQLGIAYTTAANAGFITGLYVVLIPIFMTIFWRQPPRVVLWPAALMAGAGMFLLSTGGRLTPLNRGDALELAGAVVWAFHVILMGRLVRSIPPVQVAAGMNLVCGAISLALGLAFEAPLGPAAGQVAWAVVYTGVFSIGIGFTFQAIGQKEAPAADAAILLSLEALFAALFGWMLLNELLTWEQWSGCMLMLAGMLLAQWSAFRPNGARSAARLAAAKEGAD